MSLRRKDEPKPKPVGLASMQTLEGVQQIMDVLQEHTLVERVGMMDGSGQLESLVVVKDGQGDLVRISEPTAEAEHTRERVAVDPIVTGPEETISKLKRRLER